LIPSGIALWPKEYGTLVVIDSMDLHSQRGKEGANFGTNQARGARYECFLHLDQQMGLS
jgi:hypothetical protein